MSERRYVVRLDSAEGAKYYAGNGYGGAGNPVPYFYFELTPSTKYYKTRKGAEEAAGKYGGRVGMVEIRENSGGPLWPATWLGYVIDVEPYDHRATYVDGKRVDDGKSVNVDAFGQETEAAAEVATVGTDGAAGTDAAGKSVNVDAFAAMDPGDGWPEDDGDHPEGDVDEDPWPEADEAPVTEAEGWRERQARIREKMAAYRQRKTEEKRQR